MQVVLSCVEGGPAARAGIHEGDELVEINGKSNFQTFGILFCEAENVNIVFGI